MSKINDLRASETDVVPRKALRFSAKRPTGRDDAQNFFSSHPRVDAVERHCPVDPAAIAFKAALRRKGLEADAAGGLQALDELMHAVDEGRADVRTAILRAAWTDLLPGSGGRSAR